MTVRHAPLAVRKAILARLIVHEALDPALSRGAGKDAYLAAQEAITAVHTATESELASPLAERLDDFVRRIVNDAADSIAGSKRLTNDRTLDSPLAAMRLAAASISCSTCAAGSQPCDGISASRDDALVEGAGPCIEPFRALFTLAVDIVRAAFQFALGPEILQQWPDVRFGTAHAPGKKAHSFNASAQIRGETVRSDDQATIDLIFSPAEFRWSAYLAAGYVLVHEALHVMEAIDSSRTRVSTKNEEDPFVEGWMDWIAFKLFSFVTRGGDRVRSLAASLKYPAQQRTRSRELHEARFNADTAETKMLSYRLVSGRDAARTFFDFVQRHIPMEEAQQMFLAISFRINMQGLSFGQHVNMVARVNDDLPAPHKYEELTEPAKALGRAVRAHDTDSAISWLLS